MANVTAGGIGGVARDLGRGQGGSVTDSHMRAEGNRNWMIRRGAIKIMPIGKAFVFDAKVLHRTAMRDDPRALRSAGGGIGEALQDISNGIHVDIEISAVDQLLLGRALFG